MAQHKFSRQPAEILPFEPAVEGPRWDIAAAPQTMSHRKKSALLALFLGGLGCHKFYLGHPAEGCAHITLTFTAAVAAFVLDSWLPLVVVLLFCAIEGVIYLSRTEEQFVRDYLDERRCWL